MPRPSLLALVLICIPAIDLSCQTPAKFQSSTGTVNFGESCTLTWSSAAREAYIFGVGSVAGIGSRQITPVTSTDYVLIVDAGDAIRYETLHVDVIGPKGNERYPDPDDFHSGLMSERKVPYPNFLNEVTSTLQDQFAFHIRGLHLPNARNFLIYTNWAVQPRLSMPTDKGIRQRQAAYAVQVNEPKDGVVSFDVRVLVQYQRMGESIWRLEADPAVNRLAEEFLKASLEK